jgi:pyrimidine-nucleoside phosphorylase
LPKPRFHVDVLSEDAGYITGTHCQQFGIALAMLGGGREKKENDIDHGVGLEFGKRIGDRVEKGESLATIHYNADTKLSEARELIAGGYLVGDQPPREVPPLIRRILGA